MGPKKEPKLSRFVALDDTARLPALLSSLTLLGGDSIQELEEGINDNSERSTQVHTFDHTKAPKRNPYCMEPSNTILYDFRKRHLLR